MQDLFDEASRLEELARYDILDTPKDGAFDDISGLVARFFNVPIAIVSLVDRNRVWFKSAQGLNGVDQIDRGPGLCASAIMTNNVYVAKDLRKDPSALANPLVAKENGFRFYAAAQLRSAAGFNLGTLCIVDYVPRELQPEEVDTLQRFAQLVMAQMELRLASREVAGLAKAVDEKNALLQYTSSHDAMTGLSNRRMVQSKLDVLCGRARGGAGFSALILDVDHFKKINDTYGHPAGDAVLVEIAKRISQCVRSCDLVGRYGGEEFVVLLDGATDSVLGGIAERIRAHVSRTPIAIDGKDVWITISGGGYSVDGSANSEKVMKIADEALYVAKREGRNRIIVNGHAAPAALSVN